MLSSTIEDRIEVVSREESLPGRSQKPVIAARHRVLDAPLVTTEIPEGYEIALFGLGCFWGAEELFWQVPGVWSTSVGYTGGFTPNPTYQEVCSGATGHTEAVRIVFDPYVVSYAELVGLFLEAHDPTQGMRQGNDIGTQYRSAIYHFSPSQEEAAQLAIARYQPILNANGWSEITTEVAPATRYYYADDYHQQYLAKNPHGYRCHSSTGIPAPR